MYFYVIMTSIYVVLAAIYWSRICETVMDSRGQEKSQAQVNKKRVQKWLKRIVREFTRFVTEQQQAYVIQDTARSTEKIL